MDKKLCFGCMEYIESEEKGCKCGFKECEYESEPHHLRPGTMLRERYQVGKVMGEGGFGITYVGRDMVLDLKVAIKEFYMSGYVNRNNTYSTLVRASVGSHTELFERNREKFLTEARVLAKFANEEGIVGIRDFFQENNTAYIVMDFLTGETLRDYLKENEKISWDKTLQIMKPVIKSLGIVHNHNVIHRDISPDNIMLTKDGKVKLLDFGAAREVSQTDIKSLSVILKPGYAPEEQYRSKGQQGPWTDIYALCATIYCCISGTVPEDSMERMFEDKLKPLHEVEPTCSIAVSNVIAKGMAVRQKARYQSIAELQADLDKALANPNDASIAAGAQEADTAAAKKVVEPVKSSIDTNATVYAGEIVGAAKEAVQETAQTVDNNATVYAGEIVGVAKEAVQEIVQKPVQEVVQKTTQTIDTNATVYAGEIVGAAKETIQEVVKEAPKAEPVKVVPVVEAPKAAPEVKSEPVQEKPVEKAPAKEAPQKAKAEKPAKKKKKPLTRREKVIVAGLIVVLLITSWSRLTSLYNWLIWGSGSISNDGYSSSSAGYSSSSSKKYVEVPSELSNFEIEMNGVTFALPAKYQEFYDAGWEPEDPAEFASKELDPGMVKSETLMNVKKGFGTISVSFINPTDSVHKLEDCWIYRVYCSEYALNRSAYSDADEHKIVINDNIKVGITTITEFLSAYSDSYKVDGNKYSYGNEVNPSVSGGFFEFGFGEDGILEYVRMLTEKKPEIEETFAEKAPEYDHEAFFEKVGPICEVVLTKGDGSVHNLKSAVKLREYTDLGWTTPMAPEYLVAGKSSETLELKADARTTYYVAVVNPYDPATDTDECLIYNLKFYASRILSDDTWSLVFIDGTSFDSTVSRAELIQYLDDVDIKYECVSDASICVYNNDTEDASKVTIIWNSTGGITEVNFSSGITPIKNFFQAE